MRKNKNKFKPGDLVYAVDPDVSALKNPNNLMIGCYNWAAINKIPGLILKTNKDGYPLAIKWVTQKKPNLDINPAWKFEKI